MKSEPIEMDVEGIVSELDPTYIDCVFGVRIHPKECSYYHGICGCDSCEHPRVDKAMTINLSD